MSAKTARFEDDLPSPGHPGSPFKRADSDLDLARSPRSRSPSIAETDDGEEDDYDWDAEEDLVDQEARFEQNMGLRKESWGFRRFLALTFGSLVGSTLVSGILITPALLVHFYWYKPHPNEHRRYVKDNIEAWLFWAAANLTISWYLALFVEIVPVVVNYTIAIAWGHVSENVKSRTEMYSGVKDTIKPVFYAASAWVSWVIIFTNIYGLYDMDNTDNSRAGYTVRLYDVIEFMFFFALVICGQKMLTHAIAFQFHRTAYRERLDAVQETLKVIEKLRAHRPKRSHNKSASLGFGSRSFNAFTYLSSSRPGTPTHSRGHSWNVTPSQSRAPSPSPLEHEIRIDRQDSDTTNEDIEAMLVMKSKGKHKQLRSFFSHSPERVDSDPITPSQHSHSGSASPHTYPPRHSHRGDDPEDILDVKAAVKSAAKTVKAAVLHDARNIQGRLDTDLGGLVWDVSSSYEAKRLARSMYNAFRSPGRTHLVPSDFEAAFASKEEAQEAFRVFDTDNNGDITRAEIKTTLLKVYKERRSLSRSMRDVGVALQTLDNILLFFALVILFFISLSVFGVSVGNSLTSLYTLGIGLSFVFKNACSNAFDAVMFLFVTHPFDTGDRCFIDDENLVVKKMGLFATVFTRQDGTESYYFNSQLFTKFITNARRSGKTAEACTLQVHWRTPLEKLDELEKCMNNWLSKEKNRWFEPSTSVTLQNIKNMRHLEITIGISHNGNWQDWSARLTRKTAFYAAAAYYCRQLGIIAYEAPLPIAYVDPDTQEIMAYPGEDDFMDAGWDQQEVQSSPLQTSPQIPQQPSKDYRPSALGFEPPPDGPGIRARKSKSRKAGMRANGADG
ncbi:uncharacterized protein PHACADRAFT_86174 [Phanerochaete carnosa HHB-10118-sp]|uniref:EF-hand domain-containing protein n=1 Tax=Phanerochaete carnosa (strain HHB-10118-sp) TaxID=650164 RepID=K5WJY5_PHACS|nr:uncharacterized protein PHACADRAFT_86174 [Phanerochaete carnosa HHB-10118-sp]EKM59449.1 hypothetical protein PHACADRAFT_86174 [Phanerochaete carnosa HHB-10118-sp]